MFVEHRVRSGEFLGYIANKYNCRVSDLMAWNNLSSTRINPGDVLIIKSSIASKSTASSIEKNPTIQQKAEPELSKSNKYQVHIVKSGDTLWDIAKLYGNTSVTDLKRLNSNLNFKRLKPGTEVKVKEIG
jgi:membrane-bound lytic murein transglycosylase D